MKQYLNPTLPPFRQAAKATPAARVFCTLVHQTLYLTELLTSYVCLEVFDTRWHVFEKNMSLASSVDDLKLEHGRLLEDLKGSLQIIKGAPLLQRLFAFLSDAF